MNNNFVIDLGNIKKFTKGTGPIVVVDDDEAQIVLIQHCYTKSQRKNELICIFGGDDFMHFLFKVDRGEIQMPEVVLVDINMPKKNGFDVLSEVRSIEKFKKVPIIIMFTASDLDSDKEKAQDLQANAFLSKPSSVQDYIKFFQEI